MVMKLILVVMLMGSSGIGLLSIRQSRLQAAHEMARSRLEIRNLEGRTSEIRSEIAHMLGPARIASLLDSQSERDHAVHQPASIDLGAIEEPAQPYFVLEDGTRVYLIDELSENQHIDESSALDPGWMGRDHP